MKIWEILPQLKEGQTINVTYKDGSKSEWIYSHACVRSVEGRAPISLHDYILEADYELIPQSIPFEEALKAYREGKRICCESKKYGKECYSLNGDDDEGVSFKHEILEGKWYIC